MSSPVQSAADIGGCGLFPRDSVFRLTVADPHRFPVHPQSRRWIELIGASRPLHPDWGTQDDPQRPADYYGIPYNVVDGTPATTAWPLLGFGIVDPRAGGPGGEAVPEESDCAVPDAGPRLRLQRPCSGVAPRERRFPMPLEGRLRAEGGACNDPQRCGDRHVLVLERGACRLWESYFTYRIDGLWHAYSTAAWQLDRHEMRPDGWTSADAAGLPILPLLARADEAASGAVGHALRTTLRPAVMDKRHVWPARHSAGRQQPEGVPFGALLRLRADVVLPDGWTIQARSLAQAMQQHGLYVADIGSDLFVTGAPSAQWDPLTLRQLRSLRLDQFEFVDLGSVERHPQFRRDSYRADWQGD